MMHQHQLGSSSGGTLVFKWDPKNLEIRTKSVERTLEPLVTQVTTLVNFQAPSTRRKGRSRRAHILVEAVRQATEHFLSRGEEIAAENPEIRAEMGAAIDDVRRTGEEMYMASQEFAEEPCSGERRGAMVRAARALLSAVTRLLILADMVDVHLLLKSLRIVEDNLEAIRASTNQNDLMTNYKAFGHNVMELNDLAGRRQVDLIDPRRRDEIAAARATLKKNNMMLLTSSKAYVRHPELAAARHNRDFAFKQVCDAVNVISGATQATGASEPLEYEGPGELAAALDEFDRRVMLDQETYDEARVRPYLVEQLENIISGAALLADSPCTRPDRKDRIVRECGNVRQALQELLGEFQRHAGRSERSQSLNEAMDRLLNNTGDLRHQLRQAVVDHVSDSFLETGMPLEMLIGSARDGKEAQVEALSIIFNEHASKLVEVANLSCSMSSNEENVKLVRMAAMQLENLAPQVMNAARVLAARPKSKVASENLDVFASAWRWSVKLLSLAVDEITNIEDFLAVSEGHIWEDMQACVSAAREGDGDVVDKRAGALRGRSNRVCEVVDQEMLAYQPGPYVDRVNDAVTVLRDQVIPNFAHSVEGAVSALSCDPPQPYAKQQFEESSRLVYEGVRDVRRAVVYRVDKQQFGEDFQDATLGRDTLRSTNWAESQENLVEEIDQSDENQRRLMAMLPEPEKQRINEEIGYFMEERQKLLREMVKWDDSANEILVIAKQMCMIMMEMTDFTRGRGPLKSTMDVIGAARRISEAGTRLDKLARSVADQCPDSSSKRDLLAYLQRITLYCHQLNITSKVKADVQSVGGELIVSGLDSATSLIQAAKNLMTTVVLTVKASYLASTRHKNASGKTAVQWTMKTPAKKPLVPREHLEQAGSGVYHGARAKQVDPMKEISEFDQPSFA